MDTITVTDISDEDLPIQVAIINTKHPTKITKIQQSNGLWTIIGEFPDTAAASSAVTMSSKTPPAKLTPSVSSGNQSNFSSSNADIDTLARTIWGEARGEKKEGREAVASVILNRLKNPSRFHAKTIEEVCKKPSQFSCWNDNDPNLPKLKSVDASNPVFAECLVIAKVAAEGRLNDSTIGADHYHTAAVHPPWSNGKTPCITIGNHSFFNNIA